MLLGGQEGQGHRHVCEAREWNHGDTGGGGAQKAQSSKYRGGGSSAPRAPGNSLRGEPRARGGGPRLGVQGSRKAQDGEDPAPLQTPGSPSVAS